jgi:hypothetical protein
MDRKEKGTMKTTKVLQKQWTVRDKIYFLAL